MFKQFSRSERRQLLYIGVFLVVLVLLWVLIAPKKSALHLVKAKQELEAIQVENKRLEEENDVLRKEIDRLKHDPTYFEEKARKEYGLLKKNEMLYKFDKKK
jgi:cell division protein FtsB